MERGFRSVEALNAIPLERSEHISALLRFAMRAWSSNRWETYIYKVMEDREHDNCSKTKGTVQVSIMSAG
jgi:hypothetical protein